MTNRLNRNNDGEDFAEGELDKLLENIEDDFEPDMLEELNMIMARGMETMSQDFLVDLGPGDKVDVEGLRNVVKKDGEHIYIAKKSITDPASLSVLDYLMYARRIELIEYGAKHDVFEQRNPEKATEYLATCAETLRQILGDYKFTLEQLGQLYPPLEKLGLRLTVFEPEFTEEERSVPGVPGKDPDKLLEGARKCHQEVCERFNMYKNMAELLLDEEI
ncbi:hypothetical protein GOV06_04385 [Candidatus Woesearchaeota archaeon]|nr:hypothetical protein [Candidatus Woesearchaeota archaeon]